MRSPTAVRRVCAARPSNLCRKTRTRGQTILRHDSHLKTTHSRFRTTPPLRRAKGKVVKVIRGKFWPNENHNFRNHGRWDGCGCGGEGRSVGDCRTPLHATHGLCPSKDLSSRSIPSKAQVPRTSPGTTPKHCRAWRKGPTGWVVSCRRDAWCYLSCPCAMRNRQGGKRHRQSCKC